jgi:iron-sulfur cluster repair di-iron protein
MQPLRERLEQLARKARARLPESARNLVDRLEDRVRGKRSPAPEVAPPAVEPAAAPAPKAISWELRSQADLVDHIVAHYHEGLRRDLPSLTERAARLEREHAAHPAVPAGLADLLDAFAGELESHMLKEERVLFPTLRTGARGGPIDMPILMMEREHEGHDEQLEKLRELTHAFAAPADAPPPWAALYADLAALETDLRQHIYLENNVLFARARGAD